jgi:hypothetical protein
VYERRGRFYTAYDYRRDRGDHDRDYRDRDDD